MGASNDDNPLTPLTESIVGSQLLFPADAEQQLRVLVGVLDPAVLLLESET
jgi:hypothetical protein